MRACATVILHTRTLDQDSFVSKPPRPESRRIEGSEGDAGEMRPRGLPQEASEGEEWSGRSRATKPLAGRELWKVNGTSGLATGFVAEDREKIKSGMAPEGGQNIHEQVVENNLSIGESLLRKLGRRRGETPPHPAREPEDVMRHRR